MFALAFTLSDILTVNILDREKVDHGHAVQLSQCHSMANVKLYISSFFTFLIFITIRSVQMQAIHVQDRQN